MQYSAVKRLDNRENYPVNVLPTKFQILAHMQKFLIFSKGIYTSIFSAGTLSKALKLVRILRVKQNDTRQS
jgi:hypothetical protein